MRISGETLRTGGRLLLVTMLVILVSACLYGVWPTPYRYAQAEGFFWRFSRFGDKTEVFDAEHGWVTVPNSVDRFLRQARYDTTQTP